MALNYKFSSGIIFLLTLSFFFSAACILKGRKIQISADSGWALRNGSILFNGTFCMFHKDNFKNLVLDEPLFKELVGRGRGRGSRGSWRRARRARSSGFRGKGMLGIF